MRRAALALALLAVGCGGGDEAAGRRTPVEVAREYVAAVARGDGSERALEFELAELPASYRGAAHTRVRVPVGAELVALELELAGVTGPGDRPELSEHGFDVTDGPERAEGVIAYAVVLRARTADGGVHPRQVVELRPAGSFEPGRRTAISSADGWAGRWKVLPPAR